jgi:uncharacterized protein involved in exopolysaccharide biosynthesis
MEIRRATILGFTLFMAGLVLCGVGLWLLLSPAQYQSTVRIMVNPDMPPIGGNKQGVSLYDPYFIQTEFEVIQSEVVFGKVIEALNLNMEWGKKYAGGGMLTTNTVIAILKNHLRLTLVRNTKLIEISFTSEDPIEAARIANAIAKAYQDYRINLLKQNAANGLKVLQQKYQEEEKKIQILQTNVDLLREKYKINKDVEAGFENPAALSQSMTPTEREERQQESEKTTPFWEEKRKLNQMIDFNKLLQAKIAAEKLDLQIPNTKMVQIVEIAQPPKLPDSPNRFLGAVLLAIGLFPTVGGFLMLKSSRHRPRSTS